MTIDFHEQAAARFNTLAQELLAKVRKFPSPQPRSWTASQLHPVARLNETDVIGEIDWKQRSVNGLGEETGRYWEQMLDASAMWTTHTLPLKTSQSD